LILLEYAEALSQSLSASVPAGSWRPSGSYIVLVAKRSGTYRELSFPCLIDTIARFLGDVRITCDTTALVNRIVGEIMDEDIRMGSGYAQSMLLRCLNKHGDKEQRDKIRNYLTLDRLQDDQLRLHYLYLFSCRAEVDGALLRAARHLDTPDIALTRRSRNQTGLVMMSKWALS
jgi:hypothetical protein